MFPVGTGDEEYIGSAAATIEGIRLIKEALPECLTILGVSNISFGLPPAGREVLNSVFIPCYESRIRLRDCEYGKIRTLCVDSRGRKRLADALLFETTKETLEEFTNFTELLKRKMSLCKKR